MDWSKNPKDLERILEQLPIGLSYLDLDLRVVRMNARLLEWMGMAREEAEGRRCYELRAELRGEDPGAAEPCPFCRVPQAVSTGETQRFVNEIRDDFVIENTTVPIQDDEGEVIGTVELIEDVTARRRAERVLHERRDELERRVAQRTAELEDQSRLKDLFVDILRHDLTNPLQVVRICHRHLRDEGEVAPRAGRFLDGLEDATERAMKVVTDASTYGRLETVDSIPREEVDLLSVVERAVRATSAVHDGGGSRVRVASLGHYPVAGDPSLLELVFTNLLSNALVYSAADSPVDVEIVDDTDAWRAQVTDWGPGIPDEHKSTIFERFVRGDRGGVRGTGLGLAISRRVMRLHEGAIWVEDNPEGGSVFVLSFPKHP